MDKIAELVTEEIIARFQKVKKEIGSPFLSIQLDLWSTLNAHEAYGALNASIIEDNAVDDDDQDLVLRQHLLAFDVFPDVEHTGHAFLAHHHHLPYMHDVPMMIHNCLGGIILRCMPH